ncbi:hypothetical protein B0H14DRAFT_2603252 [Mycena olivaceomarginata]|nr:hypothetical protein B0H14DRAFT_2603252 [Mycena olivaceomarginata]
MFLPSSIITSLFDNLLSIDSPAAMVKLPLVQSWRHSGAHSASLYRVLLKVQSKIRVQRQVDWDAKNEASRQKRVATKRMKRKAAELSDSTEEEGENGDEEDEVIEDFPAPNELRGRATGSRTAAKTRSKSVDLPTEPSLDAAAPNKHTKRAPARTDDLREFNVDFPSALPFHTASNRARDTADSHEATHPRAALETVTNAPDVPPNL